MTASFYGANSEQRTPRPPEPARNLQYHFDLTPPTGPLSPAARQALERTSTWVRIAQAAAVIGLALILLAVGFFVGVSLNVAN